MKCFSHVAIVGMALGLVVSLAQAQTGKSQGMPLEADRAPLVVIGDPEDASVIASIYFERTDTLITLHDAGDGAVGIHEVAPAGADSPLDYWLREQQATPLEVFLAAAPADLEPPVLLVAHHGGPVEEVQ